MGIIYLNGISYAGGGSGGGVKIDDSVISDEKVWSSYKTNAAINEAVVGGTGYIFKPNEVTPLATPPTKIKYDGTSSAHVLETSEVWYEDAGYYYLALHVEHDTEAGGDVIELPFKITGTYSVLSAYASQCSVAYSYNGTDSDLVNMMISSDATSSKIIVLGYVFYNGDDPNFDVIIKFPKFIE